MSCPVLLGSPLSCAVLRALATGEEVPILEVPYEIGVPLATLELSVSILARMHKVERTS